MKKKKVAVENKPYIEAMLQIRRSGATVPHKDRRQRRQRTRANAKQEAIKDSLQ